MVISVPALADAAPGPYGGKTSRASKVPFTIAGAKVKGFAATVFLVCSDGDNGFNAVIPPRAPPLRKGRFSYTGRDRADGTNIVIRGRVRGARASGPSGGPPGRADPARRTLLPVTGRDGRGVRGIQSPGRRPGDGRRRQPARLGSPIPRATVPSAGAVRCTAPRARPR